MANALQDMSQALAATVEAAGPSVVRVEGRRRMAASGVVWSAEGVIVTASHVVRHEEELGVGLPGEAETASASLVGRDTSTDLAVLRMDAKGLRVAEWQGPEALKVGHLALALGRPGRTVQATLGVISALGDEWRTPEGGTLDRYLQTDLVMYPGFSGGPLVSAAGKVLGMNTSALLRGVSLAVPTPTLRRVVETLLAHGHVRRGYLGIGAQPVRLPESLAGELGQETGVMLMSVEPGSPADQGGLLLGDTVVSFGGRPARHMDDILALLGGDTIGKAVPVRLIRGGQIQERQVVVGERG